ncbi:DUF3034 family protein [Sphingomonas faeni]|uniref:DUF3034 family protein n=1 Tax=Sphingomonas faeni TaxID=185950 RepID=UPI0020BFB385|nr:DUF3034 family protein [Sphingomonas faeni]MCK8455116.1 DUF3034 family protein [Sphingomonas faeni]
MIRISPSTVAGYIAKAVVATAVVTATPTEAHEGRAGGKLMLTNGVSSIEGSSGGGISTWAVIAGNETVDGIGGSAHVSAILLPDYRWESHGAAIGIRDRLELSYARQNLDTRDVGEKLGIGRGYTLNQDVFGAKLRVAGDAIYGSAYLPQIAIGVQYKHNLDPQIVAAVGGRHASGTDIYVAATKLLLRQSILLGTTIRYTKANQNGLLGFGGDRGANRTIQVEGTLGYQISRQLIVGGEYRSKPDNLGFAKENEWKTAYAAYAINKNVTATAAYVDLGSIATAERQRGGFLSLQTAF